MGDKIKRKRQRLVQDSGEKKSRYKLYKAGTKWVVAGVTTVAFTMGLMTYTGSMLVKADSVTNEATDTSSATGDASQLNTKSQTLTTVSSDATTTDETAKTSTDLDETKTDAPAGAETVTDASSNAASTATTAIAGTNSNGADSTNPQTTEQANTAIDNTTETDNKSQLATKSDVTADSTETATPNVTTTDNQEQTTTQLQSPTTKSLDDADTPETATPIAAVSDQASTTVKGQFLQNGFDIASIIAFAGTEGFHVTPNGELALSQIVQGGESTAEIEAAESLMFNNPVVPDYEVSITNARYVNGNWEATDKSQIQLTIKAGTIKTSIGYALYAGNTKNGAQIVPIVINEDVNGNQQMKQDPTSGLTNTGRIVVNANITNSTTTQATIASDVVVKNDLKYLGPDGYVMYFQPTYSISGITYAPAELLGYIKTSHFNLAPTVTSTKWDATSTTLTGTGLQEGNTITLNNDDGTTIATTTVAADGTWSFSGVKATDAMTVTESNDLGDIPGTTVVPQYATATRTITYKDAITGAEITTKTADPMTLINGGDVTTTTDTATPTVN